MKYIIIILAMFLILIPVHVFAATESLRLSTVIGGGGTINTTDNANFATDASKKVGIGLTEGETNEKLTVDGVVSIKERNIVSDPIAIDPNFGKIYVSSYDSKLYFLSDETVTYDLTAAGKPYALDAADGTPENALYVDNDGNVGIGNSSPGARLEVSGMPVTEKGLVVNKSFVGGGIGSPTGEIIFSDSGIGESGIKIGNKTAGGDFDILNAYYNGKNIFTIQENG
ncbi:MAG: hypothetical protein KKF54_08330, partial [Candidatus Omnitrophica bacterium]|nr:hypothetical protein [Candidatus Omnitrophota bacterium]